ncbi:16S rRNA processing protein RimM [Desulfonatronum thiosulfatophilum]|uniref:Ribosome maturation factor RimM n=1 Tax=Desulfonatronum thiosulfatophilum TaxID=617002 RepID=A0A1G6ALD3_9BACT|nr:ribosome maturation factor RimM [Desulfonatronum thiosulfatophilum]SDB09206.1 16S rRNA processing protein RimM [Desulfonatronum thiosulfatophilum]
MAERSLILVGEVIKPHGLTGEFSVKTHVDSPDFFASVPLLYLRHGADAPARPVKVASWRMHNDRLLMRLEHVSGRDQVDGMRGAQFLVRSEDLPKRSADEIYIEELLGITVHLPSGVFLGRITNVDAGTGQEVWTITTDSAQEVLFPAHQDFILDVDMEGKIIRIDPPPGLLELYLGGQLPS